MAKILQTRIKNRFDTLTNWQKPGVELLPGEIALVQVTTGETYTNPVNNKKEPVIELLMKVGDYQYNDDGSIKTDEGKKLYKAFGELPWLSAKAADVHEWAKKGTAEEIPFNIDAEDTYNEGTLANWVQTVFNKGITNASLIADNADDIKDLKAAVGEGGSVANAIKVAIEALDAEDIQYEAVDENKVGTFVKAVTQVDGKITVTKGIISESELPNIHTSKIIVTDVEGGTSAVMLDAKLADMDGEIATFREKISTADGTSGNYVTGVSYNNATGVFTIDKGGIVDSDVSTSKLADSAVTTAKIKDANVTTAKIADNAVTTDKIVDGNVTDAKIKTVSASKVIVTSASGETPAETLIERLSALAGDISDIEAAIRGGVHFVGVVGPKPEEGADETLAYELSDGLVNGNTYINSKKYSANAGDVVLYGAKEFIWTGSAWKELGDLSRVGTLEEWRGTLEHTNTTGNFGTSQFVTKVTQDDGKVSVEYAQPTSVDIIHNTNSTVSATLAEHAIEVAKLSDIAENAKVGATIDSKITAALDILDLTSPTATDDEELTFIDTVSQDNGQVSATKKAVQIATTGKKGVVQLSSSTDSDDETLAATPKAVKAAYVAGTNAQGRVSDIEGDYMRIADDNKLYAGKSGSDMIIFDCGGAQLDLA